jgi:hypothetical protein
MDLRTSRAERRRRDTEPCTRDTGAGTVATSDRNTSRSGRPRHVVDPLTVRRQPSSMAVLLVARLLMS